jgi:hydroxymethylpyrimidine/phosphomethylpyrimidine kinase
MKTPTILTIAGSDSSGGAGIQADLKAIAACGQYGASVVTAVTAQNTRGVAAAEPVSGALLVRQLEAVFDDLAIAAVKTGMLADEGTIGLVAEALTRYRPPHVVCDPVMISKTGFPLLPDRAVAALRAKLIPLAELVTPNIHEAEALTGLTIETLDAAVQAGTLIVDSGARAVLVKGGHLKEAPATDVLVSAAGVRLFRGEALAARHTHGTGCTLSAAIAAFLGGGDTLEEAVGRGKAFVTEAIRAGLEVGDGTGPTNPFFFLDSPASAAAWVETLGRK